MGSSRAKGECRPSGVACGRSGRRGPAAGSPGSGGYAAGFQGSSDIAVVCLEGSFRRDQRARGSGPGPGPSGFARAGDRGFLAGRRSGQNQPGGYAWAVLFQRAESACCWWTRRPTACCPFFFGARDQRPGVLRTFSPPSASGDAPIQMITIDPEALGPENARRRRP